MEVITNLERAFEIGNSCLVKARKNLVTPSGVLANTLIPPSVDGPWEMSENALKNTLTYILDFLNHSCYMLCVDESGHKMFKLETGKTSPFIESILYAELRTKKDRNIDYALLNSDGKLKSLRVMQCIVKPYARTSTTTKEYVDILKGANLPDGVYILNLTDAVILRKDGRFPWQMVTSEPLPQEFLANPFIPILSTSGQEGYWDIPIPNYDDVEIVLSGSMPNFTTEWGMKTIEKAVFRGGPTGCGYTSRTNMRIKLAELAQIRANQSFLDAGIVGQPGSKTIDSKSIRFDPLYGLGYMNTGINPVERMDMKAQSRHKYIIHIDGNVHAYRLLNTMRTGSLILRVKSDYTSWVDHLLEDGVHYISVKPDLSDLIDKIKYCKENDERCMEIANRGMEMANRLLTKPTVVSAFEKTLWEVYSKMNPVAPSPSPTPSPTPMPTPSPVASSGPLSSISKSLSSVFSSITGSLPSALPSINDSLPSSLSTIKNSQSSSPVSSPSSPPAPAPPVVKKKTRKIKIVSDEEFFREKDESKTKKRRCPNGTRRNKIGNCEKIETNKQSRLRITMKSVSRPPNPERKAKIDMRELTPYPILMKELSSPSIPKKKKRERCENGTRKNKLGICTKINPKERTFPSLIPLNPPSSPSSSRIPLNLPSSPSPSSPMKPFYSPSSSRIPLNLPSSPSSSRIPLNPPSSPSSSRIPLNPPSSPSSSRIPMKPFYSPPPVFMQGPPPSIPSVNKKKRRERCPNGQRRNKDGICVPK
jgi:hypothetical protein